MLVSLAPPCGWMADGELKNDHFEYKTYHFVWILVSLAFEYKTYHFVWILPPLAPLCGWGNLKHKHFEYKTYHFVWILVPLAPLCGWLADGEPEA